MVNRAAVAGSRDWIVGGLLAVAALRAGWLATESLQRTEEDRQQEAVSAFLTKLHRGLTLVAPAFNGVERVGYRGPSDNPLGSLDYGMARLTLLPTVVEPGEGPPLDLYFAGSEARLAGWIASPGVVVRQRFGAGMALVGATEP